MKQKKTKSDSCPKAIPTIYKGIQLKSRFEAQRALLFDKLEFWGATH